MTMSFDTYELEQKIRHLLEQDAFKQWLDAQEDDAVIGERCIANRCPIANYLTSNLTLTNPFASVSNKTARVQSLGMEESVFVELPEWAITFVDGVDEHNYVHLHKSDCIEILENHTIDDDEESDYDDSWQDDEDDWENDEDDWEDEEYDSEYDNEDDEC